MPYLACEVLCLPSGGADVLLDNILQARRADCRTEPWACTRNWGQY